MIKTSSFYMAVSVGVFGMVVAACEEQSPPPQPPAPTAQTQPSTPPVSQPVGAGQVTQGGGSALGSAKRSANNLATQIDQQQRDLLNEMGEEPPPPPSDDD